MWHVEKFSLLAGAGLAGLLLTAPASAQSAIKTDLPDSLSRLATIGEGTARATAAERIPRGRIEAVELERERGHLQYSYDIQVPGQSGITEVNVDAKTGKVLGVHRESAKDEAKEAAGEAKSSG